MSDWKPCGNKILVQMDKVEDINPGGVIAIPKPRVERDEMSQMIGTLVAVGNCAWGDQPKPWAKPGDRVKFAKYAGFLHEEDGVKYRVMHDLDVVMVLPSGGSK
jgi:co-chaperonin GroES (HSP10)